MSSSASGQLALPIFDPYPERSDPREHWLDSVETALLAGPRAAFSTMRRARLRQLVTQVAAYEPKFQSLSDVDLRREINEQRATLRRFGLQDRAIVRNFALTREVSRRVLNLRHHDVQILGGLALLDEFITEMETGEGKTITAPLAACTAALTGMPVHVVTVNDYLATRDAEYLKPVYDTFGLSVGLIAHGMTARERQAAYNCDVTYASNKEIAFDYLRDRLALGTNPLPLRSRLRRLERRPDVYDRTVMRGLHYAIVDEADSVLIDEGRTPLIISRETDASEERRWAEEALRLAGRLSLGKHYKIIKGERRIELTEAGRDLLAKEAVDLGSSWQSKIRREQAVRQAVSAQVLFKRDDHYVVQDGRVQIVDEFTGRIAADRSWSEGLHQLIEVKEGCDVTSRKLPMARMTYQRFFRRYKRLSGMTGTAREAAPEFWSVYRRRVMRIPRNIPAQRTRLPGVICRDELNKWFAIVAKTKTLVQEQRPVLIGTRSVAASQRLSSLLTEEGIEHVVLNAEHEREEAEIIAGGGSQGRVTVATNMAGRGVDIKLMPGVDQLGGLHVILSERHDAGRIDRQLAGRAARQGDPGSTEVIVSLEDPLMDFADRRLTWMVARLPGKMGQVAARVLFNLVQKNAERVHFQARKALLAEDRRLGTLLAFSGGLE